MTCPPTADGPWRPSPALADRWSEAAGPESLVPGAEPGSREALKRSSPPQGQEAVVRAGAQAGGGWPRGAAEPSHRGPSGDRLRPACCLGPAEPRRAPQARRPRKPLREVRGSRPRARVAFPRRSRVCSFEAEDGQQPGFATGR